MGKQQEYKSSNNNNVFQTISNKEIVDYALQTLQLRLDKEFYHKALAESQGRTSPIAEHHIPRLEGIMSELSSFKDGDTLRFATLTENQLLGYADASLSVELYSDDFYEYNPNSLLETQAKELSAKRLELHQMPGVALLEGSINKVGGGYNIEQIILFSNNHGMALGYSPEAVSPYATWQFTHDNGKLDFYWGHYINDKRDAEHDYITRTEEYLDGTNLKEKRLDLSKVAEAQNTQKEAKLEKTEAQSILKDIDRITPNTYIDATIEILGKYKTSQVLDALNNQGNKDGKGHLKILAKHIQMNVQHIDANNMDSSLKESMEIAVKQKEVSRANTEHNTKTKNNRKEELA